MKFLQSLIQIWKIPDLRKRVLFTLGLLVIYRLGGLIPIPGIDSVALRSFFSQSSNDLFNMYNMFVGGAFAHAAIFAQGIMPYISASIIMQLMGNHFPGSGKVAERGPRRPQQVDAVDPLLDGGDRRCSSLRCFRLLAFDHDA